MAWWSATAGFRMLFSIRVRMASRARAIPCASLLESVSRIAASYRDFQSELVSVAGMARRPIRKRSTVAVQTQFLQSCRAQGNFLESGDVNVDDCRQSGNVRGCLPRSQNPLRKRAVAEFAGTAFLVTAVVGSRTPIEYRRDLAAREGVQRN